MGRTALDRIMLRIIDFIIKLYQRCAGLISIIDMYSSPGISAFNGQQCIRGGYA